MFDYKTIKKTDNYADINLITNRPTMRVVADSDFESQEDFSDFTI